MQFWFCSKNFLFIWKSSLSRSQRSESEVSKFNPRFKKNSWRSKNGPKIARLFLCFVYHLMKVMVPKLKIPKRAAKFFLKFCNLRIFFKIEFFKVFCDLKSVGWLKLTVVTLKLLSNTEGLSFETSDWNFRDLLDELFHKV